MANRRQNVPGYISACEAHLQSRIAEGSTRGFPGVPVSDTLFESASFLVFPDLLRLEP